MQSIERHNAVVNFVNEGERMSIPKPPSTLSSEARKLWVKVHKSCLISEPELLTLKMMLEALDEVNETRSQIKKFGAMIMNKSGDYRLNPLTKALANSRTTYLRCYKILGFKPEKPTRKAGRPVEKVEYDFGGD